ALAAAEMATVMAPSWPGGWRALADARAATDDFAGALVALRREASLGGTPPFSVWLAFALGAGDHAAVEEALGHGTPADEGFSEAKLFAAPREGAGLDRDRLAVLARLAPTMAGRRFVVRAFAPPEAPDGNVVALLGWAARLCEREPRLLPLAVPMARAAEAFDRPLLVAVMGEFNAGKSSLVNALAGDAVAPVGVTPTTATINVLRYGAPGGRVSYHDGTTREMGAASVGPFLAGLGDREAATIRQVEVFAPLEALRRVEIVDTPGLNSLRPEHERVAREFLVEADALVWVFAAGQAAKASEREALQLARGAGKHVLGVVNKIDRAAPDEVAGVLRHVETTLGDLIEGAVPLSAQAALAARRAGDGAGQTQSGLAALEARLDRTFFARARELKRATALAALRRFLGEARAAVATEASAPDSVVSTDVAPPPVSPAAGVASTAARRSALSAAAERLGSALAAERVTLRSRLQEGFRLAASEVRDLVQPRAWPFGEHRADPADEAFLAELLEDATTRATAATRVRLRAAIDGVGPDVDGEHARGAGAGGPGSTARPPAVATPPPRAAELKEAVEDAIERFRAYARGVTEGAATVFFRVDLPRIRLDLGAIHAALGRWSPDPEDTLFRAIERAAAAIARRAEADLEADDRAREIDELIEDEHVRAPLASLDRALAALETEEGRPT
ncbi:MAG TPA: dynamin family protein, partial [Polyangia bacterium]